MIHFRKLFLVCTWLTLFTCTWMEWGILAPLLRLSTLLQTTTLVGQQSMPNKGLTRKVLKFQVIRPILFPLMMEMMSFVITRSRSVIDGWTNFRSTIMGEPFIDGTINMPDILYIITLLIDHFDFLY